VTQSTVFVVDDDPGIRFSIEMLLETAHLPSQCFACAEDFLAACGPHPAGCLLLDVGMPGISGPQLQAELLRRRIDLPIIFLTGYADMPTVVQAMRQGATDFLAKPVNGAQLLERVQSALALHRTLRQAQDRQRLFLHRLLKLTERERAVLGCALAGRSNKEISLELHISHRTIEGHRARIYLKAGVSSLLELVQQAAWAGVSLADHLIQKQA
jgi:FixJ family two-component response regulator